MNINLNDPFVQLRPIFKLIGAVMVIIAALELFGVSIRFGGSIADNALVGIGLLSI